MKIIKIKRFSNSTKIIKIKKIANQDKFLFTPEEISEINKKLSFVVDHWAKNLIGHILKVARDSGVETVYMNTSNSITEQSGIRTDEKVNYFYESLPKTMGFQKEKVDKSKIGKEVSGGELWAIHINVLSSSNWLKKTANQTYTLDQVPKTLQGAVISIAGKKQFYTLDELKKVLSIIEKKKQGKTSLSKFYYDWSKIWSGSQRFLGNINETIVLQKMSSGIRDMILGNKALTKFWSFLLSQPQHFDPDSIGFALICKLNNKVWIINEIQTDVINKYREIANIKDVSKKGIDIDTLKDMLEANNRSNWIPYVDSNDGLRNSLLNNPNIINQLPDNSVNIDNWIKENRENMGGTMGLGLI